jgi:hypothetical protein
MAAFSKASASPTRSFEKLLKHLRRRLGQHAMPVIFGHELPEGIIGQPIQISSEDRVPLHRSLKLLQHASASDK